MVERVYLYSQWHHLKDLSRNFNCSIVMNPLTKIKQFQCYIYLIFHNSLRWIILHVYKFLIAVRYEDRLKNFLPPKENQIFQRLSEVVPKFQLSKTFSIMRFVQLLKKKAYLTFEVLFCSSNKPLVQI